MLARLKRVFTQVVKDFDIYLTILVATVVFVLGVVGSAKPEIVSSATLAVLALLASSILRTRNAGSRKMELNDVLKFRSQLPNLEQRLANAQKLDFCALSNITFATTLKEFVVDKVKQGCQVRFIFLDPNNAGLMKSIAAVASPTLDVDDHTTQISTAIRSLTNDPRLVGTDRFQARIYEYALPHSLLIVDGNSPRGNLRVEFFMSDQMPAKSPGLSIEKDQDAYWFGFFQREFEDIWERSRPCGAVETAPARAAASGH